MFNRPFLSHKNLDCEIEDEEIRIYSRPAKSGSYFCEGIRIRPSCKKYIYKRISLQFNISGYSNWNVILNEIIRFGAEEFELKFYASNTKYTSIYNFLMNLRLQFCVMDIECSPRHVGPEDACKLYILNVKRNKIQDGFDTGWSFGVIADGKSSEYLGRLISSIEREFSNHQSRNNVELIINAPKTKEYVALTEKCTIPIIHISTGQDYDHLGWITKKKNDIVSQCNYSNVAMFHNRYELNPGWLDGFDKFGYDFDIVGVKQMYNGKRFPDWVAAGNTWTLAKSILLDCDDFHPNLYINGSAIVGKKAVLKEVGLNDLLFWNEAEDLEHTRRLMSKGYTPRYMSFSSVNVLTMRSEFLKGFSRQNRCLQSIFGYEERLTHFSPIYTRTRSLINFLKGKIRN